MIAIFSLTTFQGKPHQNNNGIRKRNFHNLLVQKMHLLKSINSKITAIKNSENPEMASNHMRQVFSDNEQHPGFFALFFRCIRQIQAFEGGNGDTFLVRTGRWQRDYTGGANPVTREQRTETLESNEIELLTEVDNISYASDIENAHVRGDLGGVAHAVNYMTQLGERLNLNESFIQIINSLPLLGGDFPETLGLLASDMFHEHRYILISAKMVYYLIQIVTDRLPTEFLPTIFDSTYPPIENARYLFINDGFNPAAEYVESYNTLKQHIGLRGDIESIPRSRLREFYCFRSEAALQSHTEMLVRIFGTPVA